MELGRLIIESKFSIHRHKKTESRKTKKGNPDIGEKIPCNIMIFSQNPHIEFVHMGDTYTSSIDDKKYRILSVEMPRRTDGVLDCVGLVSEEDTQEIREEKLNNILNQN